MKLLCITKSDNLQSQLSVLFAAEKYPFPDLAKQLDSAERILTETTPDALLIDEQIIMQEKLLVFIRRHTPLYPLIVLVHAYTREHVDAYVKMGVQDVLSVHHLTFPAIEHAVHLAVLRHSRKVSLHQVLEQSQKMEAIGRISGGIAHDYNNLLTVIMNYAVLAREAIPPMSMALADIDEQIAVIKQAAKLTRRLLIMSRRKPQPPQIFELSPLVRGMKKIIQHITGDRIMLEMQLCDEALFVRVDVSLFEQALMNLVINACDSIWYNGTVTITTSLADLNDETASLFFMAPENEQASYAMISVGDTGSGINEQDLSHIFEPFFSTKGKE